MSAVINALARVESKIPSAERSYDPHRHLREAFVEAKAVILSALQATEAHVVATESAINVVREKGARIAELESDLAEAWSNVRVTSAMYERFRNENIELRIRVEELLSPPLPGPIAPEATEQYPESRVPTKEEEK